MNTILHERQLEEYYCTLCYALFDFKRRHVVLANSGLPYPIRSTAAEQNAGARPISIELPGVPLGAFAGSVYDEITLELSAGDLFVFCTDGVFEANDPLGREFGVERLQNVVAEARHGSARAVVDAIFAAVQAFRGEATPNDDMTAVALKITS
jgi:sigma-B regulation protein RsbU (phosphoserine phosphatase)